MSEIATPLGEKDSITLKWGTLKGWRLSSPKCQELLRSYLEIGASMSVALQHDTPEQKRLICEIIDHSNADEICLDWDGRDVSKAVAKDYVMNYGKDK